MPHMYVRDVLCCFIWIFHLFLFLFENCPLWTLSLEEWNSPRAEISIPEFSLPRVPHLSLKLYRPTHVCVCPCLFSTLPCWLFPTQATPIKSQFHFWSFCSFHSSLCTETWMKRICIHYSISYGNFNKLIQRTNQFLCYTRLLYSCIFHWNRWFDI